MSVQKLQAEKAELKSNYQGILEQLGVCQKRVDELQNSRLRVKRTSEGDASLNRTIAHLREENTRLIAQLNQPRQVILQKSVPMSQKVIHTTTTP